MKGTLSQAKKSLTLRLRRRLAELARTVPIGRWLYGRFRYATRQPTNSSEPETQANLERPLRGLIPERTKEKPPEDDDAADSHEISRQADVRDELNRPNIRPDAGVAERRDVICTVARKCAQIDDAGVPQAASPSYTQASHNHVHGRFS